MRVVWTTIHNILSGWKIYMEFHRASVAGIVSKYFGTTLEGRLCGI